MVLAAILWLAPHVGQADARAYAGLIADQSGEHGIDPLLVVAIIHQESRFKHNAISRTNDYGLMQVHVSRTTYRRYRGKEVLLLQPARNIRAGIRLLSAWKSYHERVCTTRHLWWTHYNHGKRILRRGPRAAYGRDVGAVYEVLRARYGGDT